jgi:hypothetical protein
MLTGCPPFERSIHAGARKEEREVYVITEERRNGNNGGKRKGRECICISY